MKEATATLNIAGHKVIVHFDEWTAEATMTPAQRRFEAKQAVIDLLSSYTEAHPHAAVKFEVAS